jgi:methylase of polypeptide subunit release factors
MLTINIAKHVPNAMVYGIDIEEIAIAKAKENKKKENISNVELRNISRYQKANKNL